MSARTQYCSFCGKSENEVMVLVAGPTVFVCDECVDLCVEIVAKHRAAKSVSDGRPYSEFRDEILTKAAAPKGDAQ